MVQLIVLMAAVSLPPVGGAIVVEGRIEQIDPGRSGPSDIWIRGVDDRPILVRGGEEDSAIVGDWVRAEGTRGEDRIQRARDGQRHRYTLVQASGPLARLAPSAMSAWLTMILIGLLGVFLVLAIVFGRAQLRPRPARLRTGRDDLETAWSSVEPSGLPADPVDALAELSRRADEEQT
ncbi:MAG: hypothetical protein QGG74_02260 [Phycisphaerales bacterium]|jgi:hypothetical protein|nr:hypothetical protein [Phycisphaerales bacterium]